MDEERSSSASKTAREVKIDQYGSYRDFSRVPPDEVIPMQPSESQKIRSSFPMKLYQILSNDEYTEIISWLPHGRAWRINNTKLFEERVMPLYFRTCHCTSFLRQVTGWNFQRICTGKDKNAYFHEYFLRGLPHLCQRMVRSYKKSEEKRSFAGLLMEDSPDFYRISELSALPPLESQTRPCSSGNAQKPSLSSGVKNRKADTTDDDAEDQQESQPEGSHDEVRLDQRLIAGKVPSQDTSVRSTHAAGRHVNSDARGQITSNATRVGALQNIRGGSALVEQLRLNSDFETLVRANQIQRQQQEIMRLHFPGGIHENISQELMSSPLPQNAIQQATSAISPFGNIIQERSHFPSNANAVLHLPVTLGTSGNIRNISGSGIISTPIQNPLQNTLLQQNTLTRVPFQGFGSVSLFNPAIAHQNNSHTPHTPGPLIARTSQLMSLGRMPIHSVWVDPAISTTEINIVSQQKIQPNEAQESKLDNGEQPKPADDPEEAKQALPDETTSSDEGHRRNR